MKSKYGQTWVVMVALGVQSYAGVMLTGATWQTASWTSLGVMAGYIIGKIQRRPGEDGPPSSGGN